MLVGLTLLVSVMTVVGIFGRFNWFLEMTTHFRLQYLLLLAVAALAFLLGRHYRYALAAGLFASVNLVFIIPFYLPASQFTAVNQQTYRALMLNVLWYARPYEEVKELIQETHPDFILLVEVNKEWLQELQELREDYPFVHHHLVGDYKGAIMYSRFPATGIKWQRIGGNGRASLAAQFEVDGQLLTVVGAHPNAPLNLSKWRARNQQMEALARFVAQRPDAVLLLGDLNITPWSPFFRDFLQKSGLRNGRNGHGLHPTWPTRFLPLRIPIDHALVSPEITIHHFERGPHTGSDHYPIIVDFSIG